MEIQSLKQRLSQAEAELDAVVKERDLYNEKYLELEKELSDFKKFHDEEFFGWEKLTSNLKAKLSQAEAEKDDAERRWSEIADSLQKKISVYEAQEKAWLSRIVVGDMDACGALIDALKIQGTKLKEAEAEIRRIKNG